VPSQVERDSRETVLCQSSAQPQHALLHTAVAMTDSDARRCLVGYNAVRRDGVTVFTHEVGDSL